jgi:hypothetical protein
VFKLYKYFKENKKIQRLGERAFGIADLTTSSGERVTPTKTLVGFTTVDPFNYRCKIA